MTTHAIIRNGVRALVASLLAAVLLALLAFPAQAKGKTASTSNATKGSGAVVGGWDLKSNPVPNFFAPHLINLRAGART